MIIKGYSEINHQWWNVNEGLLARRAEEKVR
jgi:hypothetical protein